MSTISKVERKRGRITSADSPRMTSWPKVNSRESAREVGRLLGTRGFPPDRCSKCHEATIGVRKCKCSMGRKPSGKVWINGMLRFIDGCPNCGGTLHTLCSRTVRPEAI